MKKAKKPRKTEEEKLNVIAGLRMIDDTLFETFIEDATAFEEILQVLLENPDLRLKSQTLVGQKRFSIQKGRAIRVDAYGEDQGDAVYNIEVQRSDNTNHLKRVRYNAACITVKKSEPGDNFKDVQELYVVYISEFDLFGEGLTIYHVSPCITENNRFVDNGLHEVYVNTIVNDGSKIARLMRHFLEPEFEDPEFPATSARMFCIKHDKEEVMRMCKKIEDYARRQSILDAIELLDEENYSQEEILIKIGKKYDLTKTEAQAYYEEVFVLI
jgi:hypothetical protein